jgi:glutaredoxin-related protein
MGCCSSAGAEETTNDRDSKASRNKRDRFDDLRKDGQKGKGMGAQRPARGSRAYDDRPVDMDAIARGEDSDDSPRGTPVHTPKINYASNVPVMDPTSSTSSISEDPREETMQPAKEATVPLRPAYAPQFAAPAAGGPNSLAMSADELAKQRAEREEARKEAGVAKPIEIFFDDDDEVDGAAANGGHHGGEEEAVEMFAAGVNVASPTRDLGVESARRKAADEEPPDEYWFEERGVMPPKSVTWFQTGQSIQVEICPANEDVGYALEDGYHLKYNCQDPSEMDLLDRSKGRAKPLEASGGEDDIILYTTTITASREVRDHCRGLERVLYMHKLQYHAMDVAENGFMRKQLIEQCGGEDLGLPLLFVGSKFIGTYAQVQHMVDEGKFLDALGPAAEAAHTSSPLKALSDDGVVTQYRVELSLLHPLEGAKFTVEKSNRPGAAVDEQMLVLRATKQSATYWAQLIRGSRSAIAELGWLARDTSREPESDGDDDDDIR